MEFGNTIGDVTNVREYYSFFFFFGNWFYSEMKRVCILFNRTSFDWKPLKEALPALQYPKFWQSSSFIFCTVSVSWIRSFHDFRGLLLRLFPGIYTRSLFGHPVLSILFMQPYQTNNLYSICVHNILIQLMNFALSNKLIN